MLSLKPQGTSGQGPRQQGKPSRHPNPENSKAQRPSNGDRKGRDNSPFSKDNVFQRSQKPNGSSQTKPTRTSVQPSTRGSYTALSEPELQAEHTIGQFQFDPSNFKLSSQKKLRELPKFLVYQSPALKAEPVKQDAWDKENQEKMMAMEQRTQDPASLYEDFQTMREVERRTMENKGLVDKEGTRKTLEDAISFRGSCLEMCPVYERIRRSVENDVRKYERDESGKISRSLAIKAFSRPAAGQPPPLPSDVRPPQVLVKTLSYLIDNVLVQLPESQSFLWDRTRSIRQDFTYQNFSGPEAVECHEKIVRIHIVTLHIMAKSTVEYSQQQELEQMNKAFKTLSEMYTEYRSRGIIAPNEAEFRAYYLLSQIHDPELDREVQSLPSEILKDEKVQTALNLRNMIQCNVIERGFQTTENVLNFYKNFFESFKSGNIPILMSYLIEIHLNVIRFYALKSIKKAIHTKSKPYPVNYIQSLLAFDNEEGLEEFCSYYGIDVTVNEGTKFVDLVSLSHTSHHLPDKKPLKQPFTTRHDHRYPNLKEVVNSGKPNLDTLIPEDPKADFIPPRTASTLSEASTAPVLSFAPPQQFTFAVDTKQKENLEAEAQKKLELDAERQREVEIQRKKEEEILRLKREETEAREQKEREEQQRIMEVKQRMIQRQEAKRQKRTEIVDELSGPLFNMILKQVVSSTVSSVTAPLVSQKLQKKKRKETLLNSYSEGLYEAFISEMVYFESLEVVSNVFRERKLKELIIKKVGTIAHDCKKKVDLKKRKREELMDASRNFGIPKLVKKKKMRHHDSTLRSPGISDNSQKYQQHQHTQPKPIDLTPFKFDGILKNVSNMPFDNFEMILYSEEFQSTTSKFLQRKFAIGEGGMEKVLRRDDLTMKIIGTDKIDPKYFENVNVLVFNCDGIEKIKTQRLLLRELVEGISLNTNFKFDILVIYWEFEGIIKFSNVEILQELKIPSHEAIGEIKIVKLDPSLNCDGIQNVLDHMCEHVELTTRGKYNHKYKQPSKPMLPLTENPLVKKGKNRGGFTIAIDSPGDNPLGSSSDIMSHRTEKLIKNLDRHIQDSPRARTIPKLLSSGIGEGLIPVASSSSSSSSSQNGVFAIPSLKGLKPAKAKLSNFGTASPLHFDDMFKPKKNKLKVDVYSTPRPKSSDMLQTPSFAANSSTISNLSNITFANHSVSTPIINKPTYAQVVESSLNKENGTLTSSASSDEGIPKSILDLRRLAASVKERHAKK